MKTRGEIERLKADWLGDGSWDLEQTEGFEEHRDELLAYRLKIEEEADKRYQRRLQDKAIVLGVPGNVQLAAAIEHLEQRVRDLNTRLCKVEGD